MKGAMATGLLVSRHLGACGFKRSVKTSDNITGGFQVGDFQGMAGVRWAEPLKETERRMFRIPAQTVADLPAHKDGPAYLAAYADALRPRWEVNLSSSSLSVAQKKELEEFATPDFFLRVRWAIREAGAQFMAGCPESVRSGVAVTKEPGFVRVMVRPWVSWGPWPSDVVDEANQVIIRALHRNGWKIDCHECLEGFVVKVRSDK